MKYYGSYLVNIKVILEGQNGPFGLKMNTKTILSCSQVSYTLYATCWAIGFKE